jgi:hypothetical protein
LNCNPHFHCIAIDGVYAACENGQPAFHQLPPPENEEVFRLTGIVAHRVESLLKRRGLEAEANPEEADPLSTNDSGMAGLLANSVRRKIAVGANSGRGVVRLGDRIDTDDPDTFESPRCAMVAGFSAHANVSIEARDRTRLERLIRYAARPAVATERLSELPDGRLLYRLKRPWRDGTNAVVFERQDFIAKLAVLVPAPRAHLTRYHGVLGPCAAWRPLVIPAADQTAGATGATPEALQTFVPNLECQTLPPTPPKAHARNYTWQELMKRVFLVDVLQCEVCGGAMKILASIHPPGTTRKILHCLGLPTRPPPLAPSAPDPTVQIDSF